MRIEFRKIGASPKIISFSGDSSSLSYLQGDEKISLSAEVERVDFRLVRLKGVFEASLELICSRSGAPFWHTVKEDLTLYLSDGIWPAQSQRIAIDPLDVIDFLDGFIDLGFILEGEVESIRLDYNIKE